MAKERNVEPTRRSHTIKTTVEGGEFRPIMTDEAIRCLADAFKRWVDAGKPDFIPEKIEKEHPHEEQL